MIEAEQVWVFNGMQEGASHVGSSRSLDQAERLDQEEPASPAPSLYTPWTLGSTIGLLPEGYFQVKKPHQATADFIGRFTSASMEHHHYQDGQRQT